MTRSQKITFAGLTLFLAGLVATGFQGYFTPVSATLCIAGLIAGNAVFFPRLTRNLKLYANMILYSLFFVASLAVFFRIVQRHPASYDATRDKVYSLSHLTQNFMNRLSKPVRVTAFLTEADRERASQLLGEYARFSPQFSYDIVNPFREVSKARRFGFTVMPGDVYVEALTTGTQHSESSVKLNRLNEEELTNGIVQALRGQQLVLYFLTGHGEPPLETNTIAATLGGRRSNMNNLAWLKQQLEAAHIKVLPLQLSQRNRVPSDASVVISVAPRVDLTGAEKEALAAYLSSGGKTMFLLNPDLPQVGGELRTPLRNIADLLEEYGVVLPREFVVMPVQTQPNADVFSVPVLMQRHRITEMEGGEPLVFAQTRPVLPSRTPPPEAVIDTFLVSPGDSWRMPMDEVAKAMLTRQKLSLSVDAKELRQCPVGVAVTMLPAGATEESATRVVAIGNGSFVSTELIDQKGWILFQNAVNWLTNAGDLIAIPTASIQNTPIELTSGQTQFLFLLMVIIVPALIGFVGIGYCVARREGL